MTRPIIGFVGVNIPGHSDESVAFDSMKSLAEYDVVVFRPTLPDISDYEYIKFNNGDPALKTGAYNKLAKYITHWCTELMDIFTHGKTIIVLATPDEEIRYIGKHDHPEKRCK